MKKHPVSNVLRLLSIVLYVFALTQACFDTQAQAGESGEGIALLISGAFGFFSSAAGLTWLANPALWISWIFMRRRYTLSMITSLASLIIGLLFLKVSEFMVNEGGTYSDITGYRIGYWLWLSSITLMFTANLYIYFFERNQVNEAPVG
ncbi:MAG TPA: hypothetical protein VIM55_01265 [Mucilaginibacter sp.]